MKEIFQNIPKFGDIDPSFFLGLIPGGEIEEKMYLVLMANW